MQLIQRFFTDLIPFAFEVFQGKAVPGHILTSLTLFQLVGTCVFSERIFSRVEHRDVESQLLVLQSFWFLVTLSVLLWILEWVTLRAYGGN